MIKLKMVEKLLAMLVDEVSELVAEAVYEGDNPRVHRQITELAQEGVDAYLALFLEELFQGEDVAKNIFDEMVEDGVIEDISSDIQSRGIEGAGYFMDKG